MLILKPVIRWLWKSMRLLLAALGYDIASNLCLMSEHEHSVALQGYEEVEVPAVDPAALLPPAQLVEVASMEPWAQSAFKGYKTLNRIQSRIFEARTQ